MHCCCSQYIKMYSLNNIYKFIYKDIYINRYSVYFSVPYICRSLSLKSHTCTELFLIDDSTAGPDERLRQRGLWLLDFYSLLFAFRLSDLVEKHNNVWNEQMRWDFWARRADWGCAASQCTLKLRDKVRTVWSQTHVFILLIIYNLIINYLTNVLSPKLNYLTWLVSHLVYFPDWSSWSSSTQ